MTPILRQTNAALVLPALAMTEMAARWGALWAGQSARLLRGLAGPAEDPAATGLDHAADAADSASDRARGLAADTRSKTLTATARVVSGDEAAASAARDVTALVEAATGAHPSDPIAEGRVASSGRPTLPKAG